MKKSTWPMITSLGIILSACNNSQTPATPEPIAEQKPAAKGTLRYDVDFLSKHDSIITLQNEGEAAKVIVSARYQGKVFTSSATGDEGTSFGWINYKAFEGKQDEHMNAYGGENRFWLGPEGGKYSLFFKKGTKMEFADWHTPAAIDTESWEVISADKTSVAMQKQMELENFAGTKLSISAKRSVSILPRSRIAGMIGVELDSTVQSVGYTAANSITNTGKEAWTETTGMPCIWMLDMFTPSATTTVLIPFNSDASLKGKVATTDYFGEIPADRIKYDNGVLYFKADGKSRGKLGIPPLRAKPVAGSYDAENKILTVTMFDVDTKGKYLNQEWNTVKPPFSGDAVNAYNDGPLEDGSQMGPFYEIESVSPAAFLAPGASQNHNHSVFHFTGDEKSLNVIVQKLFGISIDKIKTVF